MYVPLIAQYEAEILFNIFYLVKVSMSHSNNKIVKPLKRQDKNTSENVVC